MVATATVGVYILFRSVAPPTVGAQLRRALDSRVLLEQAKGVLAQRGGVDMDRVFAGTDPGPAAPDLLAA